jgi:hypothetical protein
MMALFVMSDKGRFDRLKIIMEVLNLLDENFPVLVALAENGACERLCRSSRTLRALKSRILSSDR